MLQGTLHDGLYMLPAPRSTIQVFSAAVDNLELWHQLLAHSSPSILQHLISSHHLACKSNKLGVCESYSKAKSHRLLFVSSNSQATKPLEVVHCYLWGASPITPHSDYRYYILFTDEFSKFNWIYICASKCEVAAIFDRFKLLAEIFFSTTIKTLQLDGGTEFLSIICANPQLKIQICCPYTPQQNGLVERRHWYVAELSLASMFHSHIPKNIGPKCLRV
jgi:GAG-pre-integrase domain